MKVKEWVKKVLCIFGIVAATGVSGEPSSLSEQINQKASLAVKQFQERAGGKLNYSENSIAIIEEMLEEASQYSSQMQESEKNTLAELMACYILQVAYKKYGGNFQWHNELNQPVLVVGEPNFSIAIIAFGKVKGRLEGDKGDNIVFFYQGFSERVKSAKPGTKALYI